MNIRQIFLLVTAVGLIPFALSYGIAPHRSLGYLFGIFVGDANLVHIFRAVMGLYLAMALFWILGTFKAELRQAALCSLVVFMFGLAGGRILSLILDGIPHWILIVYLFLELAFGSFGMILLKKPE